MSKKIQHKKTEERTDDEAYFIYLKNPLEYRRQLLESSRKSIHCLKSYQRIILLRQRKIEELQKLKASIKELLYLDRKLSERLPKYDSKFLEGPKDEKAKRPKVQPIHIRKPIASTPHNEKSELDRLEDSLSKIENKLRELH
jgi:hypothetical protein